jgi:asparagine N-glycosylation enzyme membrane subunit Stt3
MGDVFGAERVRLIGGGDAEYHVLRAQLMAADWPQLLWVDPHLDSPYGALIPWPPLLDHIVATVAVITGSGADAEHVARVAAIFPVIFAALTALLLVPLARVLTGGSGIAAAFIASMLPASVGYGFVGLADQHVLELLLWCSALLAYALGARARGLGPAVGLGSVLALAFWNWPGSGAYLVFLSGHAALAHGVEPGGPGSARAWERTLAMGAAVAALLLTGSVALLGPPGALQRMSIVSVGGLSVVLCAAVAAGAGVLLLAHAARRSPAGPLRRIAEVAAAGLVAAAALMSVPGVLDGVRHGLVAAGAANAWFRSIGEFWPMLGSGIIPIRREVLNPFAFFGLALLALPFAAAAGRRAWIERPERRSEIFLVAVWCAASLVAGLARMRFMLYLSVPVGVCCAAWLERVARRRERWRALVVAGGALAIVAPAYVLYDKPAAASEPRLVDAIRWIAASASREPQPFAVLAPWTDGHAVRAAGLPVIGSPFGTEVSVRSLRDEATFFSSVSGDEPRALAHRRRIGFVIARDPIETVWSLQDLREGAELPTLVHETRSLREGARLDPALDFSRTVMARLFYGDGMAAKRHAEPAFGWARLLREELPPDASGAPDPGQIKTFGIVPGALLRVRGALPGGSVFATARVTTNARRAFTWSTYAVADGAGEAVVRVPYASGENGACRALPYAIGDGARSVTVTVRNEQVTAGAEITVELPERSAGPPEGRAP